MRLWRRGKGSGETGLRPSLFGDLPLEEWPSENDAAVYPWSSFVEARVAWLAGNNALAQSVWDSIAHDSQLEARHNLQGWHFLKMAGIQPSPQEATQVLGVIAEVAVRDGHDVLAAYSDRTVRYLNHAGGAVVVDDVTLENLAGPVDSWLDLGRRLAAFVGVWEGDALPVLPPGHTRILMLTPGGFRFGQGPDAQLRKDAAAAEFLEAATQVLVVVTQATK